jgi:Holliday junction resolvasome RuvABC endonuclease subunit
MPKTMPEKPESNCEFIAIDPSSSRSGWAAFGLDRKPLEIGLLKPKPRAGWLERVQQQENQLVEVLYRLQPAYAVIEIPQGKVHNRHRGGGAGLSVYGFAAGYLTAAVGKYCPQILVKDSWIGRESKDRRKHRLCLEFPEFSRFLIDHDSGGDMSDALGLGLFHLRTERAKALA